MANANEKLEAAYNAGWFKGTPNSDNCSGFLKSAGKEIGFDVGDFDADGIIAELEGATDAPNSKWEKLGTGEEGLQKAIKLAFAGRLVVAAATAKDYSQRHGHVAILLPKLAGAHKAPLIYGGGSAAARSKGTKTIRDVWSPKRLGVVRFFAHRTVLLGAFD